ncbi:MAG: LysR substrate-binding domain-containing protein [Paracoccaceae bacterium]|nr:LysR substrate-binding domain-containing protein [Paracoccaceae bacterium]
MPLRRLPALSSVRAFESAARLGSFKRAAEELSVTPGAVSQHIKALEADIGVPLFERKTRAVQLTHAGTCLQPALSEAFLQIRQAFDRVCPSEKPRLRINSSGPIISKWLLPRLHSFTAGHPDIQLFIEADHALSTLERDEPEVVIRYTSAPPDDFFHVLLHRELLIPVMRPDLCETRGVNGPEDLSNMPLLHDTSLMTFGLPPSWTLWSAHTQVGDMSDLPNTITFERHAADQVIDAAVAGSGLALARSLLVASALLDGRLTCPFGPVIPSGLAYYLCCKRGRETDPFIASFFAWAIQEAAVLSTLNALQHDAA